MQNKLVTASYIHKENGAVGSAHAVSATLNTGEGLDLHVAAISQKSDPTVDGDTPRVALISFLTGLQSRKASKIEKIIEAGVLQAAESVNKFIGRRGGSPCSLTAAIIHNDSLFTVQIGPGNIILRENQELSNPNEELEASYPEPVLLGEDEAFPADSINLHEFGSIESGQSSAVIVCQPDLADSILDQQEPFNQVFENISAKHQFRAIPKKLAEWAKDELETNDLTLATIHAQSSSYVDFFTITESLLTSSTDISTTFVPSKTNRAEAKELASTDTQVLEADDSDTATDIEDTQEIEVADVISEQIEIGVEEETESETESEVDDEIYEDVDLDGEFEDDDDDEIEIEGIEIEAAEINEEVLVPLALPDDFHYEENVDEAAETEDAINEEDDSEENDESETSEPEENIDLADEVVDPVFETAHSSFAQVEAIHQSDTLDDRDTVIMPPKEELNSPELSTAKAPAVNEDPLSSGLPAATASATDEATDSTILLAEPSGTLKPHWLTDQLTGSFFKSLANQKKFIRGGIFAMIAIALLTAGLLFIWNLSEEPVEQEVAETLIQTDNEAESEEPVRVSASESTEQETNEEVASTENGEDDGADNSTNPNCIDDAEACQTQEAVAIAPTATPSPTPTTVPTNTPSPTPTEIADSGLIGRVFQSFSNSGTLLFRGGEVISNSMAWVVFSSQDSGNDQIDEIYLLPNSSISFPEDPQSAHFDIEGGSSILMRSNNNSLVGRLPRSDVSGEFNVQDGCMSIDYQVDDPLVSISCYNGSCSWSDEDLGNVVVEAGNQVVFDPTSFDPIFLTNPQPIETDSALNYFANLITIPSGRFVSDACLAEYLPGSNEVAAGTDTGTDEADPTATPTTVVVQPTATSVPATQAPATATSVPATATSAPPATATSAPPTAAPPTATSVPPTATSAPPTATSAPPTATSVPPTATPVPPSPTPESPTPTSVPLTATPEPLPPRPTLAPTEPPAPPPTSTPAG